MQPRELLDAFLQGFAVGYRMLERAGVPRSVAMKLTGHKTEVRLEGVLFDGGTCTEGPSIGVTEFTPRG